MVKKTKEMRDDFSRKTIRLLRERVSDLCSKPDCKVLTRGASSNPDKTTSIGVAAHITAAASGPGAARYDARLSSEQRKHYDNGIWLCQTCSRLIDVDENKFPVYLLKEWKETAEQYSEEKIGKQLISSIDSFVIQSLIEDSINKKDNGQLKILQNKLGVTEQALGTFFTILEKEKVETASLAEVLCEIAFKHREALERLDALSKPSSEYNAQIIKVRNAINLGEYKSAEDLLLQIILVEKDIANRAREVRKSSEIEENKSFLNAAYATGEIAQIKLIELNYLDAADYFKQASELTPAEFISEKVAFLAFFALAMKDHGVIHGNNESIHISINAYNQVLGNEPCSEKRASIQDSLGSAYSILGERTGNREYFTVSIEAYRQALDVLSYELTPYLWASTQNNLGIVYSQLDLNELAIEAYQKCLKVRNFVSEPKEWGMVQNNLGILYLTLSESSCDNNKLHCAIDAFKLAEKAFRTVNDKSNLCHSYVNLSGAYYRLANKSSNEKHISLATNYCKQALSMLEKDNHPMDWALAQYQLGLIFFLYYEITNKVKYLRESKIAYEHALIILTESSYRQYWRATHFGFGKLLSALGREVGNKEYVESAFLSFEKALEACTDLKAKPNKADIKNSIGNTLFSLNQYQESIVAYCESLEVRDIESDPILWADTQNNLGRVYLKLGLSSNSSNSLDIALNHFDNARSKYKQFNMVNKWVVAEQSYGDILSILGIYKKDKVLLKEAIVSIIRVIQCYKNDINNPSLLLKYEQNLMQLTTNLNALSL